MKKILFASNNPGKIKEVQEILSLPNIQVVSPDQVFKKKFEVDETGSTFAENALIKAKDMGDKSGLITIADDSGLQVDALNGEPGVYSARYASSPELCNQKVLEKLIGIKEEKRTARFKIAICIYNPKTKKHQTVFGSVEGRINLKSEGDGGFGYDPIFYSTNLNKTFAQASSQEKNNISHRKIALEKAKPIILKMIRD
jgi:XTP/dITP diphosphohydrolase